MPSLFQRWSLLRFALCRARSSLSTGSTSFENNDTLQGQVLGRKRTILSREILFGKPLLTISRNAVGVGLPLSRRGQRANDLDCRRTSRQREAVRCFRFVRES